MTQKVLAVFFQVSLVMLVGCPSPTNGGAKNTEKAVTAFSFPSVPAVGIINETEKTVLVTVPFGTDLTVLVPEITHTGMSISPASGTTRNFSSPVTYTVTAEDGSTQPYVVTVSAESGGTPFAPDFDGSITKDILVSYLSKAVTHAGLCQNGWEGETLMFDEDLRMILNIGAKFIGRASFLWSPLWDMDIEYHFSQSASRAAAVHEADPYIILQACIFENVAKNTVNNVQVPSWVFQEFGLPVESRAFIYENMLFQTGDYVGIWGTDSAPDQSAPDITRQETKMWVYYLARRYIDAGFESLHFGQVDMTGKDDKANNWESWYEVLSRILDYGAVHARRRKVLFDAHTAGMLRSDGSLLLDFHSAPLRPYNTVEEDGILKCEMMDWSGASFAKNLGGLNPNGFESTPNLCLLEFDNGGIAPEPGQIDTVYGTWGYDEITWFRLQPDSYRNDFLVYADTWLKNNHLDNGSRVYFLQPATRRQIETGGRVYETPYTPGSGFSSSNFSTIARWPEFEEVRTEGAIRYLNPKWYYRANARSDACPVGFSQEVVIKGIFAGI